MALPDRQEVRDLLNAASATRNYCMLTGRSSENSDLLIDALAPFEGNPDDVNVSHLVALRKAMRDVCQDIDHYTLTRILDGDPPVWIGANAGRVRKPAEDTSDRHPALNALRSVSTKWRKLWPAIWQRALLPGLAVALLISAMHFTHWSFNANLILNQMEKHLSTDVHEEVRDLIVIARAIEQNGPEQSAPGASTPAQKLFSETMSQLRSYHHEEELLRAQSTEADRLFNPLMAGREFLLSIPANFRTTEVKEPELKGRSGAQSDRFATKPPEPSPQETTEIAHDVIAAVNQVEEEVSDKLDLGTDTEPATTGPEKPVDIALGLPPPESADTLASDQGEVDDLQLLGLVDVAIEGHKGFKKIVTRVADETGRNSQANGSDHVITRLTLLQKARELQDKIAMANRFALPMIYGSLGAALFCLVRVLTPALSDLGPARAFLRVLFGAFSAMTLSMLFIPANVFSINSQSNPTLIFLACFLFGYSFDAVLTALHRLEAFLQGRLKTTENS